MLSSLDDDFHPAILCSARRIVAAVGVLFGAIGYFLPNPACERGWRSPLLSRARSRPPRRAVRRRWL